MMKPIGGGVYSYGSRDDADEELKGARRIVVPKRGARAAMMRSQQLRRRRFLVGGSFSLLLVVGAAVCTFGNWDDAQFGALSDIISGVGATTTAMTTSAGAANAQVGNEDRLPAPRSPSVALTAEFLARSALSSGNSTDFEEFDRDGDGELTWHEIASGIDVKRDELLTDIRASNLSEPAKASVASAVTDNLAKESACVQAVFDKANTSSGQSVEGEYLTVIDGCSSMPPSNGATQDRGAVNSSGSSDASSGTLRLSPSLAVGPTEEQQRDDDASVPRIDDYAHSFADNVLPVVNGHHDSITLANPLSEPERTVDPPRATTNGLPVTITHNNAAATSAREDYVPTPKNEWEPSAYRTSEPLGRSHDMNV